MERSWKYLFYGGINSPERIRLFTLLHKGTRITEAILLLADASFAMAAGFSFQNIQPLKSGIKGDGVL